MSPQNPCELLQRYQACPLEHPELISCVLPLWLGRQEGRCLSLRSSSAVASRVVALLMPRIRVLSALEALSSLPLRLVLCRDLLRGPRTPVPPHSASQLLLSFPSPAALYHVSRTCAQIACWRRGVYVVLLLFNIVSHRRLPRRHRRYPLRDRRRR